LQMDGDEKMKNSENMAHILEANRWFVASRAFERFQTSKFPDRRLVILACMDTRLVGLLEQAMGIGQGQAIIIRVAGAQVRHPLGSTMQSILVAVHMLQADEVVVVGHHDCGMQCAAKETFVEALKRKGISAPVIRVTERAGVDLEEWLEKFDNVYDSVRESAAIIANHPFLAEAGIPVHGLVIDPHTGKLEVVVQAEGRAPQVGEPV
jgi:carbonic anhydrase